jgi:cohesin complex subunit SCC1
MFYSDLILIKKGPLSQVWLAAHWQQRLTKSLIRDCDIDVSINRIRNPDTPHALRLSGQLLLGLVRIYQKKVQYLREDSAVALTKINVNLRQKKDIDLPQPSTDQNLISQADPLAGVDDPLDQLDTFPPQPEAPDDEDSVVYNVTPEVDFTFDPTDTTVDPTLDDEPPLFDDEFDDEPEAGRKGEPQSDGIGDMDLEIEPFDDPGLPTGRPSDASFPASNFSDDGGIITPARASAQSQVILAKESTSEEAGTSAPTVQARKRQRKAQPVKRDRQTELKSKQIQKQIDDTTDIVLPERDMLPLRKRQKLQYEAVKDVKSIIKDPETSMESLGYAYCTEEPPLAQELRDFLKLGYGLRMVKLPLREDLADGADEKKGEERVEELEQVEEPEDGRHGEQEYDDFNLEQPLELEDLPMGEEDPNESRMSDGFQSLGPSEIESKHSTILMKPAEDATKLKDAQDFFGEHGDAEEDGEESMRASERTKKTLQGIKNEMKKQKSNQMNFQEWVSGRSQTTAALAFYQLLVLKSHQYIGVSQDGPFEDIIVSKGPKFSRTVSSVTQ